MKKIQKLIDSLINDLDCGFLTQKQALFIINDLRDYILEMYEEYSENADSLIAELLEAHSVYMDSFNLN